MIEKLFKVITAVDFRERGSAHQCNVAVNKILEDAAPNLRVDEDTFEQRWKELLEAIRSRNRDAALHVLIKLAKDIDHTPPRKLHVEIALMQFEGEMAGADLQTRIALESFKTLVNIERLLEANEQS
ncbi:MAG: hypothetical protein JNM43_16345 [Planctomycetaceae bacterium]|nr:hypothetical protein [Planctomycetaceae bacterium]